jgi:hypothetical protein
VTGSARASAAQAALGLAWLLALLLCSWIYQPGLDGPAFLDDAVNLRVLDKLEERPELLLDVVRGNASGPLGRPVSMLGFGLERIYLADGLRGTKRLNLALHLVTGSVLFLLAITVCREMKLDRPELVGLIAAALWLFNPLFTSTVLYTVQRMALLATLFSLLSLWCYCMARRRGVHGLAAAGWLLACVACFVLAAFSKENALLVVPLLMLLEWQVYGFRSASADRSRRLASGSAVLFGLGSLAALLVITWDPDFILSGYQRRNFTLGERLLTEARILWSYCWQLLWPQAGQLGLYQDDQLVSRSWLSPASTLPAVAAWAFTLSAALYFAWQRRLTPLVLGLLFFLVGHLMESTLIPLELYFEHRNYLPAAGLMIGIAGMLSLAWSRWPWLRQWLLALAVILTGRAVLVTATEAQIWSSEYIFHMTALNRHPDSVRANAEMSRVMALGGDIDEALHYSARVTALEGRGHLRHQLRELLLYCYALPAIPAEVVTRLTASAEDFSDDEVSETAYLLVTELLDGKCADNDNQLLAGKLHELSLVPPAHRISPKLYVSLALLDNELGNYQRALDYVNALLARSPGDRQALSMRLYFALLLGLDEERLDSQRQLEALRDRGLLSDEERYNLELLSGVPAAEDSAGGATR